MEPLFSFPTFDEVRVSLVPSLLLLPCIHSHIGLLFTLMHDTTYPCLAYPGFYMAPPAANLVLFGGFTRSA